MGKQKAFWSVYVHVPADDNLITSDMMKDFYAKGRVIVQEAADETRARYKGWELQGDVLDFGCGIGRLGIAFSQLDGVRSVTCVDQSVFHLSKAKQLTKDMPGHSKLNMIVSGPDLLIALHQSKHVPKCFDFVHSLISLQHIITPLQAVYLEQLCDVLKPGGVLRVQIPSHTPMKPACDEAVREKYRTDGGMQMHSIDPASVIFILEQRGCTVQIEDVGIKHVGKGHNSIIVHAEKRLDIKSPCREYAP